MALTNFTGPVNSVGGFQYNGTGVTMVGGTNNTAATTLTIATGLTSVSYAQACLAGVGTLNATAPAFLTVNISGTNLIVKRYTFGATTPAITAHAGTVRWAAWGSV